MESQKNGGEAGGASGSVVTGGVPRVAVSAISRQCPPIPPAPSFMAFPGRGINYHSYIPIPICLQFQGLGLVLPPKALLPPQLITRVVHQSDAPKIPSLTTPCQPRNGEPPRKKPEIVELDDSKDDVEVLKNAHHWRDHWVIHLISVRGEMQNTFNSPPKQGVPLEFIFPFFLFLFLLLVLRVCIPIATYLLVSLIAKVCTGIDVICFFFTWKVQFVTSNPKSIILVNLRRMFG